MPQKYIQVTPTREELNPNDIVQHLSSLRQLNEEMNKPTLSDYIPEFINGNGADLIPRFEFLVLTQGFNSPVECYYGTDEEFLQPLYKRVLTAYPQSFNVEFVEVSRIRKLVTPEEYVPNEFLQRLESKDLQFEPENIPGTAENMLSQSVGSDGIQQANNEFSVGDVAREGNGEGITELAEMDDTPLAEINPPSEIDSSAPVTALNGPTLTKDGTVLARPTLANSEPVVVHWHGKGERRDDWMTTMKFFSDSNSTDNEDSPASSPLAPLFEHLANCEYPIGFQVVFERMDDWSKKALKRKRNIHLNRDTFGQKIMYELSEVVHGESRESRKEKRRKPFDDMGESGPSNNSAITGKVDKRAALIDNKIPNHTFRVNVRAVALATADIFVDDLEKEMKQLASYLDHVGGYFYELEPEIITNDSDHNGTKPRASEEFHRFLTRDITSNRNGTRRSDLILNSEELANFITVPPSSQMTVEGTRGTRAEAESRDPLPRPDPDIMEKFRGDGMRIGYALNKDGVEEDIPTKIPNKALTQHFARFAASGHGKSISVINDMLSLYEDSDGPLILIDPKGDGMAENYMRAHFQRFGEQSLRDDVIHFNLPEKLPGFTFFDIRPDLTQGVRRVDAIQNKADHYEELLKLVMGSERYRESKVAPTIIKALIKSLFDSKYGDGQYNNTEIDRERESSDFYSHNDLEYASEEMQRYVKNAGSDSASSGSIPNVQDERIHRTLARHANSDPQEFNVIMDAVFNRLDYIREDTHLRRIFDNTTPNFDFRNHLNSNKVILFDLGPMRQDATEIMAGLILTNLWDALKQHDRTKCTVGHDSLSDCKEYARTQNISPERPPCRDVWGDDHLVNLFVDEAASVAVSDIFNTMLEKGRSFNLSVGLSMQFPKQLKVEDEKLYTNVLNNIDSMLIGNIKLDEDIAEILAHEEISPIQFRNRLSSLPQGEWIAQLGGSEYRETGPEPFSVAPIPAPAGHPAGTKLEFETEQYFNHLLENTIFDRVQSNYGIPRSSYEKVGGEDDIQSDTEVVENHNLGDGLYGYSSGGEGLPDWVESRDGIGYRCTRCGANYPPDATHRAKNCCTNSTAEASTDKSGSEMQNNKGSGRDTGSSTVYGNGSGVVESVVGDNTNLKPIGDSEKHGEPNSYDPDHINEGMTIDSTGTLESAINEWNRSSVLAVGRQIQNTFPAQHLEVQSKVLNHLVEVAQVVGVRQGEAEPFTMETFEIAKQNGFASADVTIDVKSLVRKLASGVEAGGNSIDEPEGTAEPDGDADTNTAPIEFSSTKLSTRRIEQSSLERPSLDFMATIVDVMNNDKPIDRDSSLGFIRDEFQARGANIDLLTEEGFVIEHRVGNGGVLTYTVTPKGRNMLQRTLKAGPGIGDLGDAMPHRYGADLSRRWLSEQPDIAATKSFIEITDDKEIIDLVGLTQQNGENQILRAIEIEGGNSRKEVKAYGADSTRVGLTDHKSLVKDCNLLATLSQAEESHDDYKAIWVARDSDAARSILTALANGDCIQEYDSEELTDKYELLSLDEFNDTILSACDCGGIHEIYTFKALESRL